ncbi:nitric oxide synthase oxygenase [Spirosoma rhododendri]|uniref:nitric oxide dioxygenase n=1 Tax=Spirosoma rhododendri TaxID=2728024 RepID=A0A7L5DUN6_9BACT|nr:nitric oxide synthase oxygenase [Spirosoma rhododendri]QJD79677.1 nitric-oxide synthase [Spirosoma rhododendri]
MVSLTDPDRSGNQLSPNLPALSVTNVLLQHIPDDGYEYKGMVWSLDEGGRILSEQVLQVRRKPEWLVNVLHQGEGQLVVDIQARPVDGPLWQPLGRTAVDTRPGLTGSLSVVVEQALPGWVPAPELGLSLRLSREQTGRRVDRQMPVNGRASRGVTATMGVEEESLTTAQEMTPMTAIEQVIVRDIWNKLLAYQDMLVGMFFERLLHEEPELIDNFGDAIDEVPRQFAELFDTTVRQLKPRVERPLRETYQGIYPAPEAGPTPADRLLAQLAELGMRPAHWQTARRVWNWMLTNVPYLEDYDRENLAKGVQSASYRFFSLHILAPALTAIQQYDRAITPDMVHLMRKTGDQLATDPLGYGVEFYRLLFQANPDVLPYFGRTDMDNLSRHLMQTVAFLIRSLDAGQNVQKELRELARIHANHRIPAELYGAVGKPLLAVMRQANPAFTEAEAQAWLVLLERVSNVLRQPMLNQQHILKQADEFIRQVADELTWEPETLTSRLDEIEREIRTTGTYTHTYEELAYGAQLAWRNASKCIGRIAWRNMIVRDLRHLTDPDDLFRETVEHLRLGTNSGNVQIVMNVFRPKKPLERWGPRIWNSQYIRFAAYEQPDGTILGDKANLKLTQAIIRQGWTPPAQKTAYDCLPLVIDVPGHAPRRYEFDPADVLRIPIEHPNYPAFADLGMQWCAVPVIANFRLAIGGVDYGCAPFNGWFMETEITRNLWEDERYGMATQLAQVMGLDTSTEQTLWRDRAFLELNAAVLHSFTQAKVTLVDHQTAAQQFMIHDQREKRAGRECPAQWSWVTPAAGGSTTTVWHHEMRDFYLSPSYHYAADKWAVLDDDLTLAGELAEAEPTVSNRPLILYGSETGTAERYARQTARRLSQHRPRIMALDEFDPAQLAQEQLVLVVTSTFGNGEAPGNAANFLATLRQLPGESVNRFNFSVMALGSTIYPNFCAAGIAIDRELARVGGNRVISMQQADEIKGQADSFRQWLELVARLLGEDPTTAGSGGASTLSVTFLDKSTVCPHLAGIDRRRAGVSVPVVANRELLKEVIAGSRSTRFLSFDISGTSLQYETGDHVAIYPQNPAALVERLCQRLGVAGESWFTTKGTDAADGQTYDTPVQVADVLTNDVDLSLHEPFDELLSVLLNKVSSDLDRYRLTSWQRVLARDDQQPEVLTLKADITARYLTVVDLLDEFASANVSFADLLAVLPRQKPRLYSISSCSLANPEQIHLTVGVVRTTTEAGRVRQGLCSNFLAGLDPAQRHTVRLAVRTSGFRPPVNPEAPMLLVGPGTGLAPLMGFLQHREIQLRMLHSERNGSATPVADVPVETPAVDTRLFFGCHDLNDYLYQHELETWHEVGLLTHLDVAFSRMGDEKIYVQDLIAQQSTDLWNVLSQPDCHYYVCGDARMADDVFDVLMNIARKVGGLTHAQAVDFFRRMKAEKRFVADVWGVLLNAKQALAEVKDARYTQGERWLERVGK